MLYEIYRPKMYVDLVGQEDTSKILTNQIKTGKVAHSYLLCGTRGTGKTSTARIHAKAVNCESPVDGEPCGVCNTCISIDNGTCMDVVELDAATHTGIDSIRDIMQDAQYAPSSCKFKVYIIDEVHMLSKGAVSAFLKTLEEPPKHVIFILATTDPQKLPITILSRCQRYDFKRISVKKIAERLAFVASQEKENIPSDVLNLIAKVSDGAMRDALSILEKIMSTGQGDRTEASVSKLLSMAGSATTSIVIGSILNHDMLASLKIINKLDNDGQDFGLFIKDLIKYVRNLMVLSVNGSDDIIAATTEDIVIMKQIISKSNSEKIINLLELLQTAENDLRLSGNAKIALEAVAIKANKETNQVMDELKAMKDMIASMQQQLSDVKGAHYDSESRQNNYNHDFQDDSEEGMNGYNGDNEFQNNNNNQNNNEEQYNNEQNDNEANNASQEENIYQNTPIRQENPVVLAKRHIIECSRKVNRNDFADAVQNSKMFMKGNLGTKLLFNTNNENEKEILEKNKVNLVNGFSKFLEKGMEVEVR